MTAGPNSDTTTLPAIECASWCSEGQGHTGESSRGDQWCDSDAEYVTLTLEEVNKESSGYIFTTDLGVSARRRWRHYPHVNLHVNAEGRGDGSLDVEFDLTADEARTFAQMLMDTANLIDPR